ncbi:cell division protein FtsA [Parabacteroides sp. OttesenSCG-928-G07]|nr:cell division protein FtsA [Parabacteroides sp. OttesenSCG-928-G07]
MAYTNFIAAIDLGTAHITGMVGEKKPDGKLHIIASDIEYSGGCIRRGCVYNVEETATRVKRLVARLENRLSGSKIGKIYVGIGGHSVQSIDHSVYRDLGEGGVVTEDVIASLHQECLQYKPEFTDVLTAVSPVYMIDNKREANPVGIPCSFIEAKYKVIVGRPCLRTHAINSITERAKIEIAGFIVSPLALADVVLSEDEKNLGCALIDFGAGVTTLTVFNKGLLVNLSVIPFGGDVITKDIVSLHILETEAERIKKEYGNAMVDRESDTSIQISTPNGLDKHEIKLTDLNNVIEARQKEILENVFARLEATGIMDDLGAGIVITGGASALHGIPTVIQEKLNMNVRYAALRRDFIANDSTISTNAEYAEVIGLLMKGTENCAIIPDVKDEQPAMGLGGSLFTDEDIPVTKQPKEPTVKASTIKKPVKKVKTGPSLFDRLVNKVDDIFNTDEGEN